MTGKPGMDGREFARWKRFYVRQPFGLLRDDVRAWVAGVLARVPMSLPKTLGIFPAVMGLARDAKPKRKPAKRAAPVKRQGVTGAQMKAWVLASGGTVVDGKSDDRQPQHQARPGGD